MKRRWLLLMTLAAALFAALAASAWAAPGTTVQFTASEDTTSETIFSSTIPGCPTASRILLMPDWLNSGPTNHWYGTKVFDCGDSGQFGLAYSLIHKVDTWTSSGTWTITGGTDMYRGMTGQGKQLTTFNPDPAIPATSIYTGTIRLATG